MADIGMSFLAPIQAQQGMDQSAQMHPLLVEHQKAVNRYMGAMTGQMEYNLEGEKKAAAAIAQALGGNLAGGGGMPSMDGGGSPAEMLTRMAQGYANAGLPDKATKALEQAGLMRQREATAATAKARVEHLKSQDAMARTKLISNLLDGVKDQASWEAANQAFETQTQQQSPYSGMPYDPKMVDALKKAAITAKERAELGIRERDLQSKIADRQSAMSHRLAQENVANARLQVTQAHEARLAKAGGKDVGAPSKIEMDGAFRIIGQDSSLALTEEDKRNAAFDVAAQAKALRKSNPGMTQDEALRQALTRAKAGGDFATKTETGLFGRKSTSTAYAGGGKTADTAIGLPASGKVGDLVVGKFYSNSAGKTMQWTKGGWKAPTAAAAGESVDEEPTEEE